MMRTIFGDLPTCVQRVDYPIHKGQPNPSHGTYYFVGSIPGHCTEPRPTLGNPNGRASKHYASESDAITAAIVAGAKRIQRVDCSFVEIPPPVERAMRGELFDAPFNLAGESQSSELTAEAEARVRALAQSEARKAQRALFGPAPAAYPNHRRCLSCETLVFKRNVSTHDCARRFDRPYV